MFICIPKDKVEDFKRALKDKTLNMADLVNMSTEERTKLFSEYGGVESAKAINSLFEEKLVLKNRLQGIKNWASKVGEIGRYDPAKKAKLEQMMSDYRARQQERIFSPREHEAFLNDLVDAKIGTHITKEEAKSIFDLTTKADDLKKSYDPAKEEWSSPETKAEYGATKVLLENYVSNLKTGDLSIKDLLKARLQEFKQTFETNKPKAVGDLIGDVLKTISDNSISLVATLDNSFLGRQGLKTLQTHPTVWWKGAKNSFIDLAKTIGGKNMKDALMADIYSSPNYLNGSYDIAKLIPRSEEQFPTSLPERIYGLGRVFKASEIAFTGSAIRMRTGLYDLLAKYAKENGVDMTDKYQIQSMGKMINSLTGRGQWGKTGEPAVVRLVLWAPRMLKGNIDVLTAHLGQDISPFARKQAAINLMKIIGETAVLITVANAIKPGSAETDPRSTNFGSIKIGNTKFDFTGGASSLVVLASRLASNTTKSSSGLITEYGSQIGQTSRFDAFIDFLTGKTTPAVKGLIEYMKGKNFAGQKPTVASSLYSGFTPISIQNIINLKDDSSANAVLGTITDALGFNATTRTQSNVDWGQSTSAELKQFREKVGEDKFKAANDAFNQRYNDWFASLKDNAKYNALSDDLKRNVLTNKKVDIKNRIFKEYGFKYKAPKKQKVPKF